MGTGTMHKAGKAETPPTGRLGRVYNSAAQPQSSPRASKDDAAAGPLSAAGPASERLKLARPSAVSSRIEIRDTRSYEIPRKMLSQIAVRKNAAASRRRRRSLEAAVNIKVDCRIQLTPRAAARPLNLVRLKFSTTRKGLKVKLPR